MCETRQARFNQMPLSEPQSSIISIGLPRSASHPTTLMDNSYVLEGSVQRGKLFPLPAPIFAT
jgi:hypothetical protein